MLEKLILVFLVWEISSQKLVYDLQVDHPENCPSLVSRVYPDGRGRNVTTSEGGRVTYLARGVASLSWCVSSCCDSPTCQAALLAEGECRHLTCSSAQDCLPVAVREGETATSSNHQRFFFLDGFPFSEM